MAGMKNILPISIIVIFAAACTTNNSDKPKSQPADTIVVTKPAEGLPKQNSADTIIVSADKKEQDIIDTIRAEYRRINEASLTQKTVDWKAKTDEGLAVGASGQVVYFFENNKLVKIYSSGGEDHGEWKEEFYYDNTGKPFFVYRNNAYGGAMNPTEIKVQTRVYLKGGKIVKSLTTNTNYDDEQSMRDLVKLGERLYKTRTEAEILRAMRR